MKLPFYIVIILLAVTFVPACRPSAFDAEVARAEALMESAPDSALAIAESLRPDGRAEHARAALLLLKARYKAYVPLTDDSLARLAADYFDGDDSLAVQANFFLGDTYFNLKRYDKSLVAAKTGQDIAARIGDKYYEGLIARLQADIYNDSYDVENELKYKKLAIQCFSKAKKESHVIWARLEYANAVGLAYRPQESLRMLDSLSLDTVGQHPDFHLQFHRAQATDYYLLDDYSKLILALNNIDKYKARKNSYDWAMLSFAYVNTGELDMANSAADSAMALAVDRTDTCRVLIARKLLYQSDGDYKKALEYSEKHESLVFDYMDSVLTHPYNALMAEAYHSHADRKSIESNRLRKSLYMSIAVVVLLLIIVILVVLLVRRTVSMNKAKIAYLVSELNDLEKTLRGNNERLGVLSQEKIEITGRRIEDINLICTEIFRLPSYAKETKKVLHKFDVSIEDFRTMQMQGVLEEYLNSKYGGVMEYLHSEHPGLSEKQIAIFTYCALDFTSEAMALLTSSASVNGFLSAKSRLKRIITDAATEHTELFVSLLNLHKKNSIKAL